MSPRSPNGFYYSSPSTQPHPQSHQHYHHQSMTNGSGASPHYSHHQFGGNPHSNYGQQMQPMPPMPPHMQSQPMFGNGYNNHQNSHYGSGNYSHRSHGFGK